MRVRGAIDRDSDRDSDRYSPLSFSLACKCIIKCPPPPFNVGVFPCRGNGCNIISDAHNVMILLCTSVLYMRVRPQGALAQCRTVKHTLCLDCYQFAPARIVSLNQWISPPRNRVGVGHAA